MKKTDKNADKAYMDEQLSIGKYQSISRQEMDKIEKLNKSGQFWIKERALYLYIIKCMDIRLAFNIASKQYLKMKAQKIKLPTAIEGRDFNEAKLVKTAADNFDFYRLQNGDLELLPYSEIRVYEHLKYNAIKRKRSK